MEELTKTIKAWETVWVQYDYQNTRFLINIQGYTDEHKETFVAEGFHSSLEEAAKLCLADYLKGND